MQKTIEATVFVMAMVLDNGIAEVGRCMMVVDMKECKSLTCDFPSRILNAGARYQPVNHPEESDPWFFGLLRTLESAR